MEGFGHDELGYKASIMDYEQLILKQIDRIMSAFTKEFGGGIYDVNRVTGETIYIQSPEESFMNGVIALYCLISPYFNKNDFQKFDEAIKILKTDTNLYVEKLNYISCSLESCKIDEKEKYVSKIKGLKIDHYSRIFMLEMNVIKRCGLLLSSKYLVDEI